MMSGSKNIYKTIIIGGGPAGVAAAIYAARKKLKTLLITENIGGQSIVSDNIENWVGEVKISGVELAKKFEKHLKAYKEIEIKMPEKVISVKKLSQGFRVLTNKNFYLAKTLIIASGARRKHLDVPGGKKFEGKGIAYCSTCDAPFFKNKIVGVIGGGNSALETILDLEPYAKTIYLIVKDKKIKGDPILQEKVWKLKKLKVIYNAETRQIFGEKFVKGLKYFDKKDKNFYSLKLDGIFVEIGTQPNSEIVKDLVKRNKKGEIIINHKSNATSFKGIFAAGDVTNSLYRQNNISAGEGIKAALSAYYYLSKNKRND